MGDRGSGRTGMRKGPHSAFRFLSSGHLPFRPGPDALAGLGPGGILCEAGCREARLADGERESGPPAG